jgi:catalase (peroxidase I)
LYDAPFDAANAAEAVAKGNLTANTDVLVTEVEAKMEAADGAITLWAKTEQGWFQATSSDGSASAEVVLTGWNDKPQEVLEDEAPPNQMMLVADMVLLWDPIWNPVILEYADDDTGDAVLRKDFAAAYKKLTELGVPNMSACPFAH